jgi:hypothetical protein
MKTDEIAVVTMVYGDAFLEKWIAHHAALFGRRNLIVISHGADPRHDMLCEGLSHITIPRAFDERFAAARMDMVNGIANGLLQAYRRVIFLDVDEVLALDPGIDCGLADYLRRADDPVLAPLGIELVPPSRDFVPDWSRAIAAQAPRAIFSQPYCKPCIRATEVMQRPGGHAVNARFRVDPNLLLLHLKYVDPTLYGRYDALVEQMESFAARPSGKAHHWTKIRRGRPPGAPSNLGTWPVAPPASVSEGLRDMEEPSPGWFRCDRSREGVSFTLPEAYRGIA